MESHGIVYFYFYFNKHTYAEETKQRKRNSWLSKTLKQEKAAVVYSEIVCKKIYYNPSDNVLTWAAITPYLFVVSRLILIAFSFDQSSARTRNRIISNTPIYRIFEAATEIIIIKYLFLLYVFRI